MTLKYTLREDDYLDSQLFISSKSKTTKKNRKKNYLIVTFSLLIIGFLMLIRENNFFAYYLLFLGILALFLYPKYQAWFYKRHYRNHVKSNMQNLFNESNVIEFNDNFIETSDRTGLAKINITEVDQITEINEYFYIRTKSNQYLIVPKDRVDHESTRFFLTTLANKLNIEFVSELNWKWH
ncbi:YcxB family protein [Pedobacter roseus]|uniref:YcxB family protein n=1 Tax=Pedobacter roseus TaxID=336820 RepID=A0A7G9QAI5_9SPHI|nr:YcxB family protein [Pedobacter roseus]QNN40360.1 YcxB family protein [Pedobacter roseus]